MVDILTITTASDLVVTSSATVIVDAGYSLPLTGSLPVNGGTMLGTLILDGSPALEIPAGAAAGKTFISDATGNGSWQSLPPRPAAWWQLADASGASAAADSSGNGWAGVPDTVTFGVTGPAVFTGTAASFGGSPDGILTSFNPAAWSAITVDAWVNVNSNSLSGSPRVVANSHTDQVNDNKGFELYMTSGRTPKVTFGNGATSATVAAGAALSATGWHYLAGTWDGTTVTLYVDGVSAGTSVLSGTVQAGTAAGTSIGYDAAYNGDYFKGYIAQAAVTPAALTAAQISLRYAGYLPAATSEAIPAWGTSLNVVTPLQPSGDTTGTTDTAAIQTLLNNAGTVVLDTGQFYVAGLVPVTGARLTGQGNEVTVLNCSSADAWNMQPGTLVDHFELDHLQMNVTGGNIFSGANIIRGSFHHLKLIQNSASKGIWYGSSVTLFIECSFYENVEYVYGATRTQNAWYINSAGTDLVTEIDFANCVLFNENSDSAQYYHWWQCSATNALIRNVSWRKLTFEHACGGAIHLESVSGCIIDDCSSWDTPANSVLNPLIQIKKNSSNSAVPATNTIRGFKRVADGPNTGIADIQLDSNCAQTLIQNCAANGTAVAFTVDCGSSSNLTLVNMPSTVVYQNLLGGHIRLSNGAFDGNAVVLSQSAGGGLIQTIQNTTSTPTQPSLRVQGQSAGDLTFGFIASGDTNSRAVWDNNGQMKLGPGNATQDTNLYRAAAGMLQTDTGFTSEYLVPAGLTGAVGASRYVGATTSGAPASGTFVTGDWVIDRTAGIVRVCTSGGTPGTWVAATSAAAVPFASTPGAPSSTVSATLVMMGLGSTWAFTPVSSGRMLINVTGLVTTATAVATATYGGRYGTGTAPANGTAVTGTRFGAAGDPAARPQTAGVGVPFGLTALLSLTPSTAYWFDLALDSNNSSDAASFADLSITIVETS